MDVNAVRPKKLDNIRSKTSDDPDRLIPHRPMSLEQALELIQSDECVEVTPSSVRLRKVILDGTQRGRAAKQAKRG